MQVDVACVVVSRQMLAIEPAADGTGWEVRGVADVVPYASVDGKLVSVTGNGADLLRLLGYEGAVAASQTWPAGPGGAAPPMQEVAAWWLAALSSAVTALGQQFAGRTFVAGGVTDGS